MLFVDLIQAQNLHHLNRVDIDVLPREQICLTDFMSDDLHLGMWMLGMRHDVCKNSVMGFKGFESLSSDGNGLWS